MANRGRLQTRHGTGTQFEQNKSTILPDELVIVDSGDTETNGSAVYYKPNGGTPKRLANADEISSLPNKATIHIIDSATSEGWTDYIPESYVGNLGDLALYDRELYFLSEIVTYPQSGTMYYWLRLINENDQ